MMSLEIERGATGWVEDAMRNFVSGGALLAIVTGAACATHLPTDKIVEDAPPEVPAVRVPPLSGGTLLVMRDGVRTIAADPERDRIVVVGIDAGSIQEVALEPGDEPGRLAEDDAGRIHVVLRSGNAVVTIDPASGSVLARRSVCGSPRGIVYQASLDVVRVACADGQLSTLAADPTVPFATTVPVESDLRDVALVGDQLFVTRFRSSELLAIGEDGAVIGRNAPEIAKDELNGFDRSPQVAWRMTATSTGQLAVAHELSLTSVIDMEEELEEADPEFGSAGAYASSPIGCRELVWSGLTVFETDGSKREVFVPPSFAMHLPVDVAVSNDCAQAVLVDPPGGAIAIVDLNSPRLTDGCDWGGGGFEQVSVEYGTPVAVAFRDTSIIVQTRQPSGLVVIDGGQVSKSFDLGGDSRADTGFDLFHDLNGERALAGLACASCHPEGRDDGHVWHFSDTGRRRTQSLAGTISGTAPFHWEGDLDDFSALVDEVFTNRMAGPRESKERIDALESWIGAAPVVARPPRDADAVARGRAIFQSEKADCASCHSGSRFTNSETVDIGHDGSFQVPSLVGVAARAPYMHDGCAATLRDRFDPACGGDDHGDVSGLDEAELADLIAYLETL